MKRIIIFAAIIVLNTAFALSQTNGKSDIKMQAFWGTKDVDQRHLLDFQEIKLYRILFTGEDLIGKNYEITVKEFVNGKLTHSEVVFDSKEVDYFRIDENKLSFYFLAQQTPTNTAKFGIQFDGWRKPLEYKIAATDKDFSLKTFLGSKTEMSVPLNKPTYFLAFLMPTVHPNSSTSYCEVVQSEVKPEELGTKYSLPRYFLFDIKFHK
jgi:hypothetical protein